MTAHIVAAVKDFPPGTRKLVKLGRRDVVVFNVGGEFFALNNRCPHLGGSLFDGIQTSMVQSSEPGVYACSRPGELVKCPWHGWGYDIRTGQSWCDPADVRVRQYETAVMPGAQLVAGPLVAETLTVRVEDDYVLVEA
jgi:3-phenylpropionate/trans-cinnamate dioxygenase ferredoxin subunit